MVWCLPNPLCAEYRVVQIVVEGQVWSRSEKGKVIFQTGCHFAWPGPAGGPLSAVTVLVAASEVIRSIPM